MGTGASTATDAEVQGLIPTALAELATNAGLTKVVAETILEHELDGSTAYEFLGDSEAELDEAVKSLSTNVIIQKKLKAALKKLPPKGSYLMPARGRAIDVPMDLRLNSSQLTLGGEIGKGGGVGRG